RRSVGRIRIRIVNNEIVAARLDRKVAVDRARLEPPIALCVFLETRERRLELMLNGRVELRARSTTAPLQTIELVEIEQRKDFVERDVGERSRSEERRRRDRIVGGDVAALTARDA